MHFLSAYFENANTAGGQNMDTLSEVMKRLSEKQISAAQIALLNADPNSNLDAMFDGIMSLDDDVMTAIIIQRKLLPVDLYNNGWVVDNFLALGFKLPDYKELDYSEDISHGLIKAEFPEGWYLIENTEEQKGKYGFLKFLILDNEGRVRGESEYRNCFYSCSGSARVFSRYDFEITQHGFDGEAQIVQVQDRNNGKKVIKEFTSTEIDKARLDALAYLDENYPGWRNVTKYW